VKDGVVPVEGLIAVIGKAGEDWQSQVSAPPAPKGEAAAAASNGQAKAAEAAPLDVAVAPIGSPTGAGGTAAAEGRLKASPLAKRVAREAGLDLAALHGSGDGGRIVRRDVEAALEGKAVAPAQPPAPKGELGIAMPQAMPAYHFAEGSEGYEDKPVSQMRKTIARRLSESKNTAPHFYLTMEINMDKAVEARPKLNELAAPVKISFNDIVIKAAAAALRKHPAVNSSWLGDKIRYNRHVHIGVAVAVEDGLLVPVIKHADLKPLTAINQEVKALADKARVKRLQPDEMTGNTFTISNLGMFGIEEFTGIINPPDACILAVGAILQKPIVKDGQLAVGNMMKVTLSCDHRVVDGATGSEFLLTLKALLEEPVRLLV
jgi:pyruvate dehydrogenase E2 component (dihydrolipoamide acetyltransferase)